MLRYLSEHADELSGIICDKLRAGTPAIVELGRNDAIALHPASVAEKAAERIYSALGIKLFPIRVSLPRAINENANEYCITISPEDSVLRPEYIDPDEKLYVNQPMLLSCNAGTYPMVEAPLGAKFITDLDLLTSSIPGVRPTIMAYKKSRSTFQFISSAGILHDGYEALGGFYVRGAAENRNFIAAIALEAGRSADTLENRALRAYEPFIRCERAAGRILLAISNGDVEKVLVGKVKVKLKEIYKGDLGRLTLLEMLESFRAKSQGPCSVNCSTAKVASRDRILQIS
ncbi:hypothetical protein [Paracoccus tibetensis]|nr:hypothetical protein [Paracoccus tibetensis]